MDLTDLARGTMPFSEEELMFPRRLAISHREGTFTLDELNLGNPIKVIMLGLVKQRVFWDENRIVCRSYDAETGEADGYTFPWDRSLFDKPALPPKPKPSFFGTSEPVPAHKIPLPCEKCTFKSWHRGEDGRQKPAACQLQFTTPSLVYDTDLGRWMPSVISFQKSSMDPVKSYMQTFQAARKPLYTAFTEINLKRNLGRGEFVYSVPFFRSAEATPEEMLPLMSLAFRTMRGSLMRPPAPRPRGSFFS